MAAKAPVEVAVQNPLTSPLKTAAATAQPLQRNRRHPSPSCQEGVGDLGVVHNAAHRRRQGLQQDVSSRRARRRCRRLLARVALGGVHGVEAESGGCGS